MSATTKRVSSPPTRRTLAKAAATAATSIPTTPKVNPRGSRTPDELKAIAAAEAAAREIEVAAAEMRLRGEMPKDIMVTAFAHALKSKTRDGWRSFIYHQGQPLVFTGEVRASVAGALLFGFEPKPNDRHVFIAEREVTRVEVAHQDLDAVVKDFRDWFIASFGSTPEELITQAAGSLSAAALRAANDREAEEEVPLAMEQFIPAWGRWA